MIFLKRKRLVFWLIRAYLKKWGKTILASFVVGLVLFLVLFLNRSYIISKIPLTSNQAIGIAGVYSIQDLPNNLPDDILSQTSRGLTRITEKGEIKGDIAEKWEIKDDGKTFIFYLRPNVYFSDGKLLDSSSINYNFADVVIERPTKQIIVFKLKDKYSPFLVTLANRKILKKGNIGVSDFKISKVKANGGFVDYIELSSPKLKKVIKYDFYDTQAALKNAYVLGEVSQILDINNLDYKGGVKLSSFKNTIASKNINPNKIVTIFFNNQDPFLSDKKVRKAMAYSLPDSFAQGKRIHTPYNPDFWANSSKETYQKDLEYAHLLLSQSDASKSAKATIVLKTLPQYKDLAAQVSKDWEKLNIETKIEVVDGLPSNFQAFLGELPVLKDPDQYTLWHTGQTSNITNYRNLRIDKLLEDGRRTYSLEERKKIYSDFQKYLLDDMPAIFLYFPYTYDLRRK